MTDYFATIDGLKRRARKLRLASDIPYLTALEQVARDAGYPTYLAAVRAYDAREAPPRHPVRIHQSWWDDATRKFGTVSRDVTLSTPLTELVKPHHRAGYLGGVRIREDRELFADGVTHHPSNAWSYAGRLGRVLQFMEATGLKPGRGRMGYPKGDWENRHPGADHDHTWYDPVTRSYVLSDEPYPGRTRNFAAQREAWQREHGWDYLPTRWPSIYGFGAELYLLAPRNSRFDLRAAITRLEQGPAALDDDEPEPPA